MDNGFTQRQSLVEISGLTRRFGSVTALDNVSLHVPAGSVFGLVGANGAGKTTLIKHVMGLLKPQTGSVSVFGLDPVADPVRVLSGIGYLSEENDLPDWMRVDEIICYTRVFLIGFIAPLGFAVVIIALRVHAVPSLHAPVLRMLPWLLGITAVIKLAVLTKLFYVVGRQGLLSWDSILRLVAIVLTFVAANCAVILWYMPAGSYAWQVAPSACVLATPLLGIPLAPLALKWNRHR